MGLQFSEGEGMDLLAMRGDFSMGMALFQIINFLLGMFRRRADSLRTLILSLNLFLFGN